MDIFKWFRREQSSAETAKTRLQFVLVQDRMNCSPELFKQIESDIYQVLTKYFIIDEKEIDVRISDKTDGSADDAPSLYVNMPIKSIRKARK